MKTSLKMGWILIPLACIFLLLGSCHNNDKDDMAVIPSTPLYDTLGWFIQGGKGAIAGQGVKMVNDPENEGKKIQAGRLAIRTVVNEALGVIASDNKLAPYFPTLLAEVGAGDMTGFSHLLNSFTDFVQEAVSGQKDVYKGPDMVTVHNHASFKRFGSTDKPTANGADFDIFIGDVAKAAQTLKIPASVIGQLGALLNSTKGDVVQNTH